MFSKKKQLLLEEKHINALLYMVIMVYSGADSMRVFSVAQGFAKNPHETDYLLKALISFPDQAEINFNRAYNNNKELLN